MKSKIERAYFAGGCFWGLDYLFQKATGVVSTKVGFMGGQTKNPTYEEVCTGKTGHAETVEIIFDHSKESYEQLAKLFFEIHDPTQINRQGLDIGDQYRSAIFYLDEMQKKTAEKLIGFLQEKGLKIATLVVLAGTFWPADEYHQKYFLRKKATPKFQEGPKR